MLGRRAAVPGEAGAREGLPPETAIIVESVCEPAVDDVRSSVPDPPTPERAQPLCVINLGTTGATWHRFSLHGSVLHCRRLGMVEGLCRTVAAA